MKKESIELIQVKRLLYVIIALLSINILLTIVLKGDNKETSLYDDNFDVSAFTTISLKDIEKHIDTEEYKLLVIGKPKCEYTNQMLPILKQAQEEYGYETLYVDLRQIDKEDEETLLKYDDSTNFIEEYLGTTPFIIVFKENKMVDTWVGYKEYQVFSGFLEDLGLQKVEK